MTQPVRFMLPMSQVLPRLGERARSSSSTSLPKFDVWNKVYEAEQKEADALPHRHHDLETAIANLQLGLLAPRVHEILDLHRAEMPPVEEQDDDDRV
jgi:hypothetical protein